MSHWPREWYDISDGTEALENIASVWSKMGYDQLEEGDYSRLEPFLEPFDAVYNDEEIAILSRLGNNGIQKELCKMYAPEDGSVEGGGGGIFVLEWYLQKGDYRRKYLVQVATV